MIQVGEDKYWTKSALVEQIRKIGIKHGDVVMAHVSMRSVGNCLNGTDDLIQALLTVVGVKGALLCYTNWDQNYEDSMDENGCVPFELKPEIMPYDRLFSRASRDHGVFAECIRTTKGAVRSKNPGASVVAIGNNAEYFIENHSLNYGYGNNSPFAKFVASRGKILMIGAPYETMSLLHHAEHLANIPNKNIRKMEIPLLQNDQVEWVKLEEFDTVDPVCEQFDESYFKDIVEQFCHSRSGAINGVIGSANTLLVPAKEMLDYAIHWMENYHK
ncbi:aminoglycoside 3-N-acetyltransferase [Xenorhabdus lircayensis]|uniref:Aminoglycoside N(3)-acetyltransferase n=1 Tax=Xenorhabdus lircayensis TaxID=2763499 RepID=A0ABS0UA25_9GAMM|nr:aminoglycoside 3-N-acetyltransferase [Xenorhabdus lircayensis]MBI6550741.1 aminoglycoside 3-N-acetyltransferase [Xenorhabdus lircayensis]